MQDFRQIKKIFLFFFISALFTGCGAIIAFILQSDCSNIYVDPRYENMHYTSYLFKSKERTPSGILVQSDGFEVSFNQIDELTNELEQCIKVNIHRCGFRIIVAPDWSYSQCANQQRFPCKTSTLDKVCPGCSGINQYPDIIVITPDLASYKHELLHQVLHIDHGHPLFAKCQ